ncbi:MAG: SH3 domain-containing protein [Chloroflexota bacterium]|nr:SH3 domain-containing protein [Chloroflexota bacterium]
MVAPSGVIVGAAPNVEASTIASARISLPTTGSYFIRIESANGRTGDFLLSVQGTSEAAAAQALTLGQTVNAQVDSSSVRRDYNFQGAAEPLVIDLQAGAGSSPVVTLKDTTTAEVLAISSARLSAVRYRVPASAGVTTGYTLEVSSSGAGVAQAYTLCVGTEGGSAPCPSSGSAPVVVAPVVSVVTATPLAVVATTAATAIVVNIPADAACQVTSVAGTPVNVRQAPGLDFPIVSSLASGTTALVIGRLPDNSWFQVNNRGVLGWVSTTVVRIGGLCGSVTVVQPPTSPAPPTLNVTATLTPTATATATASPPPAPAATLNFSLPAVFGSTALTSGFVPDPFSIGITAGGPANAGTLGSGCIGYTTSAPSFSVNYTSGSFTLLRFYFIGGGDTTMVINSPSATYSCVDDSFATNNPTLDFNSPSSGRYDVFIGTFSPGGSIGGTLFITESSANHP